MFDLFHRKTTEALRAALAESVEPTTAWAHLPNAAHIDRILAHAKAHPDKWDSARDAARGAAQAVAWGAAREAAWNAAGAAAGAAIAALIAWDDAGDVLRQPIAVAKFLADEGDHAAILIYPAMLAMKEEDK